MLEAMLRPLFEEPSSASERPDPWAGPKGFMIGGMALPGKQDLGDQYFEAADLLVTAIETNAIEDYKLTNPVLYLYRHALELTIKSIIGATAHGHDLSDLADKLNSHLNAKNVTVPSWVVARLKEVATIDPGSTAFRYGENRSKVSRGTVPVDGEIYVNLQHLKRAMAILYGCLSAVAWSGEFPSESVLMGSPEALWKSEILPSRRLRNR